MIKYSFDYLQDSELINKLIFEGEELAKKLNPVLARDSLKKRQFETITSNAIAGQISEYLWRHWLNQQSNKRLKKIQFNKTELTDIKNQIDIEIIYSNGTKKSIEVRSSFPYTGLKNGVCKVFDIIGWYSNTIKIKEIRKDYYLRALFPYNISQFKTLLPTKFDVFLTGGSDREMLEQSKHAKDKKFIPYDELIYDKMEMTSYRVIEPIIQADDCINILNKILEEN